MKSRRYALLVALLAGAMAIAAFTEIHRSAAQQKPPDKTPTKPKGDLITVEPATPVTSTPSSEKGATPADTPPPNTQSQKPGTEVDEKQRIIINADLITFNVAGSNRTAFQWSVHDAEIGKNALQNALQRNAIHALRFG